jgi:hypothetical protein
MNSRPPDTGPAVAAGTRRESPQFVDHAADRLHKTTRIISVDVMAGAISNDMRAASEPPG